MLIDKKLFERYFKSDNKSNFINLDINTFDLFNKLMVEGRFKNNRHKTFSFSYYWLVSYLWKYSKYGNIEITTQDIKTILGVSPTEKRMDYIIKNGGLLDSIGLTETTRDFPVCTTFDNNGTIEVTTLSMLNKEIAQSFLCTLNNRYMCKKPLLQYKRDGKAGLMYSRDDVFSISIVEFTRCVLCPEIGFDGFYVYAYLKYRVKMLGNHAVKICYKKLEEEIGYKHRRIRVLIQNLITAGLVEVNHDFEHEDSKILKINNYKTIYQGK